MVLAVGAIKKFRCFADTQFVPYAFGLCIGRKGLPPLSFHAVFIKAGINNRILAFPFNNGRHPYHLHLNLFFVVVLSDIPVIKTGFRHELASCRRDNFKTSLIYQVVDRVAMYAQKNEQFAASSMSRQIVPDLLSRSSAVR